MADCFGSPQVPFGPRPQINAPRRPSQPSLDASLASLTRKNAVYYPNYRVYRGETPASLNYNCISHVFYAFAHHRYLKLILSIGGGAASQNFATVAGSAVTRDNFGRSARGLVEASGFDGIDIDWEHPADPQQGANFLSLLAAVRLHLPDGRYLLTAALPAGQWALQHIDLYRAKDYLDLINLMAYDFAGSWSTTAGHHAQLYPGNEGEPSGSAAVDYIISTGFPANKILLGVPVYGRSFIGAYSPGNVYSGCGGDEGTFEYKDLPRNNAEEIVNTRLVAAFCTGGDGGFVSYDNPDTVRAKGNYALEKRLGGLFYWMGTADAPPGPRSLISTGFKALHGG
ncbi:chitinase [Diplocarpon rosae]|nr:chitinase [Diplocarpon rosae]